MQEDNLLDKLGVKWGTDKSSIRHGYTKIYDRVFAGIRELPLSFLEIGVYRGGSIKMWEEYFPNARICGIDNDEECKQFEGGRIQIFIGDQRDPEFLRQVVEDAGGGLDIVLDDGGHCMDQQIGSFEILWKYMNSGGVYVIEDLHTSYMRHFGGGYRKSGSTVEFLKDLIDDTNMQSPEAQSEVQLPPSPYHDIASLTFYEKVCLIFKK